MIDAVLMIVGGFSRFTLFNFFLVVKKKKIYTFYFSIFVVCSTKKIKQRKS